MKTRFEKITENPERLADFLNNNGYINIQCDYCYYSNGLCNENHQEDCKKGIVKWLTQPLPIDEQFTYEDIECARYCKRLGLNYVARDKDGCGKVFVSKPERLMDGTWFDCEGTRYLFNGNSFSNLKWEDEPILLDDIMNSKDKK